MTSRAVILLVEDDRGIAASLRRVLETEGHEVLMAADGQAGLELFRSRPCDLVLTDIKLPRLTGLALLEHLHREKPRLPVIVMTAHGTSETAIEAMKLGAYDYLLKPFEIPALIALVNKALANSRLAVESVEFGDAATAAKEGIIGNSSAMQDVYKEIGRAAAKPVTVLIRGETGTGKELIARALYQHSDRADKAFIALNCAAIPETLLESELFGHERGTFTGADSRRIGRFEQAQGGTIFLDEIGDLAPNTQVKLLRVLQEKTIQRLGGRETISVDARVIAATHRSLEREIADGKFREDLFYRLNVITISVPALRERAEDIPALVTYFMQRHGRELGVEKPAIAPPALEYLAAQTWPGNVRELENAVRKSLLLSRGFPITLEIVQLAMSGGRKMESQTHTLSGYVADLLARVKAGELNNAHACMLKDAERELFTQAIQLAADNQTKAARWLGVSRLTMREKLRSFGIHTSQHKSVNEDGE